MFDVRQGWLGFGGEQYTDLSLLGALSMDFSPCIQYLVVYSPAAEVYKHW